MSSRLSALTVGTLLLSGLIGTGVASAAPAPISPARAAHTAHAAHATTAHTASVPYTCSDYQYWEDATWDLRYDPTHPTYLDTDGDGLACEDVLPEYPDDGWSPDGSFDAVTAGPGTLTVRGWAMDFDSVFRSTTVHLYVDGRLTSAVLADHERPDLDQFQLGTAYGFDTTMGVSGGKHSVCAYALDTRALSPNTALGCKTVVAPSGNPFGSFDRLEFFPDGRPVVHGWAVDPNSPGTAMNVAVYVDGTGYVVPTGTEPRGDVAAALGAPSAGVVAILPAQKAGRHTVCVYGLNTGPGANSLIGCKVYG